MNKIIFREDSRDKVYQHHFGQLVDLPNEVNFDTAEYDEVQPIGNVQCTCYTTCDIAEDQKNIVFDVDDLWARIKGKNQYGADPREVFAEAVKNGLLPKGQTERQINWKSYWKADEGLKDKFDNVRSALMTSQSPVGCGTYWYSNWTASTVLEKGEKPLNGHMYSIEGWKQINNEPHLIIEAWIGKKLYMNREVFNHAMSPYGMGAWVLSTSEIDAKRQRTVLEAIRDICVNVIIKMKELLVLKQAEPPVAPKPPVVEPKYDWSTQEKARHSVRVICDEEGLSVKDKNELCATVGGESGWKPRQKSLKPNFDGTHDHGIIQLNEKYWIGEGKLYPNIEAVYNDPEGCIRWMCRQWNGGNKEWWYAFKNGSYKKYMNPKFDSKGKLV